MTDSYLLAIIVQLVIITGLLGAILGVLYVKR